MRLTHTTVDGCIYHQPYLYLVHTSPYVARVFFLMCAQGTLNMGQVHRLFANGEGISVK